MMTTDDWGLEPLTNAELESLRGGAAPPAWWWIFTFFISESADMLAGAKAGFHAT